MPAKKVEFDYQEFHKYIIPGVIKPSHVVSENVLRRMMQIRTWQAMRKELQHLNVNGHRLGRTRFYCTDHIIAAIEKLCDEGKGRD